VVCPSRAPARARFADRIDHLLTLDGVKLVIADEHKGLRAAVSKVFHATQQRCKVHGMRNALAHASARQRPAVAAMLETIFAQETAKEARAQWKAVADALRQRAPKLAERMDGAREDVLAYTDFPRDHRARIASTNPLERLNGEIKRRSDVVGRRGLTRPSATVLLAPQRSCRHAPRRRSQARAK
jgi:transposase-like protein